MTFLLALSLATPAAAAEEILDGQVNSDTSVRLRSGAFWSQFSIGDGDSQPVEADSTRWYVAGSILGQDVRSSLKGFFLGGRVRF